MDKQVWFSTIDSRGRITIPAELRRLCNIGPGTRVQIWVKDGAIYLKPVRSRKHGRTR